MANTALDTTSKRIKWGKGLLHEAHPKSTMMKLVGKGKGAGSVILETNEKSVHTFYQEAIGIIDGAPIGYNTVLGDNVRGQYLKSQAGYRSSMAQAVHTRKIESSQTDVNLVAEAVKELAPHWARTFDQLLVDVLSVWSYQRTNITAPMTTAQLASACNPSLAANITSMNTVLNTALIGTSSCGTASYLGYNVLFAGKAEDGGPITQPAADMITTMKANPSAYTLSTDTFFYIKDYALNRGLFPTYLANGKADLSSHILLIPSPAITELRLNDARYQRAVSSGDISSREMWEGTMRMDTLNGVTIMPFDYGYPDTVTGVSAGTLLRCQASDDGKWWIVEGLLLGGQSASVSSYDDFEIAEREDTDFRRRTQIGYDIIKGALKMIRLSVADATTNTSFDQTASVIFAMRKWN